MDKYWLLFSFLHPEPPRCRPVQQSVVGSFQDLVLLSIPLQSGVMLKKLLHVCLGALLLQHLAAQLRLQILAAALRLLQQGAQLTGLRTSMGGTHTRTITTGRLLQKKPLCVKVTSASA